MVQAFEELSSKTTTPKLIANFKQPERNLLSVFMSALEIVPEFRGAFFERCGYRSGRNCQYESHMEAQYSSPKLPDVRPDGLIICQRGSQTWTAYVEAKAGNSHIRPEQIQSYADLAKQLNVDAVISISNEFSRTPTELPYHLGIRQRKGRDIFHFSWAELRTFTALFVEANNKCNETETSVLTHILDFMWDEKSAIQTFDAMPSEWSNFVQSAGTELGFTTKTPGITEIVHGWQQERRDLAAKLIFQTHGSVELSHDAGVRADTEQRLKHDRKELADNYILSSIYIFRQTKSKLRILANLKSCQMSASLEFLPPANKKAKATINWMSDLLSELDIPDAKISFDWKGRRGDSTMIVSDFLELPETVSEGQKEAPKSIRLIFENHSVRRFKSRKGFIEDLEKMTLNLAEVGAEMAVI